MRGARIGVVAAAIVAAMALVQAPSAQAGLFGHSHHTAKTKPAVLTDRELAEIGRAIEEERLVDAEHMLDEAALAGLRDPRLTVLTGRLDLARGEPADALAQFREVQAEPSVRAQAAEGAGIALSWLGRSSEALTELQLAVSIDPSSWRAWNALGCEYDNRRDWAQSETAYDHALADSDNAPIVLNNRGYSRLLQNRLDEASADFVAALAKKPDLAVARTNLRLAMALQGQYERALAGGSKDEQAQFLNNAGFAAIVAGDYQRAETLLDEAIAAKSEYYARASANLELAKQLAAHQATSPAVSAPPPGTLPAASQHDGS